MSKIFLTAFSTVLLCSASVVNAQDAVISGYLSRLLTEHPSIRAKQFDGLSSDRLVTSAWMQFLPTPSLSIDKGPKDALTGGDRATTYRISQPIWMGGRLTAGLNAARLRRELAATELQDTAQNLALRFISLYQSWWALDAKIRIQKRDLIKLESLRDMMARRVESGVSAELDLDLASVRVVQQQSDLAQSRRAYASVVGQIRELFNEELQLKPVVLAHVPKVSMSYEQLLPRVLDLSPALRKAQVSERLALVEIDQVQADASPQLSLRAERQHGQYLGSLSETKSGESRVYASLQFGLGAAGSVIPQIMAASARAKSANEAIEAAKRDVSAQVKMDWEDYFSFVDRLPRLQRAALSAASVVDSSLRLFTSGRRSWLDLINAVREHSQSELQLIDAQAALIGTSFKIQLVTGQLGMNAEPAFIAN